MFLYKMLHLLKEGAIVCILWYWNIVLYGTEQGIPNAFLCCSTFTELHACKFALSHSQDSDVCGATFPVCTTGVRNPSITATQSHIIKMSLLSPLLKSCPPVLVLGGVECFCQTSTMILFSISSSLTIPMIYCRPVGFLYPFYLVTAPPVRVPVVVIRTFPSRVLALLHSAARIYSHSSAYYATNYYFCICQCSVCSWTHIRAL